MHDVSDRLAVEILRREMGPGEAETIVLAKELGADLILIDDEKPREVARQLGLKVAGTVAILVRAWRKGLLARSPVDVALEMRAKGVWISDELLQKLRSLI